MASDVSSATSSGASAKQKSAVKGLASNFDSFLTILTTQLRNQDPMSPMKTNEFTNQLVMFAQVEQSVRQSGLMEDLIKKQTVNQALNAASYLGRKVEVEDNHVNKANGKAVAEFSYTLDKDAKTGTLEIHDSANKLVRIIQNIELKKGKHVFNWDGKDSAGKEVPPGIYRIFVTAKDKDKKEIKAKYTITDTVGGIDKSDKEVFLTFGKNRVSLDKITRVSGQNDEITNLIKQQASHLSVNAASYIGKQVEVKDNHVNKVKGKALPEFSYTLSQNARKGQIEIYDARNRLVRNFSVTALGKGKHSAVWDGRDNAGREVPEGLYRFQLKAEDSNKKALIPEYTVKDKVSAIETDASGTFVAFRTNRVPLDKIIRISN